MKGKWDVSQILEGTQMYFKKVIKIIYFKYRLETRIEMFLLQIDQKK